MHPHWFVDGRAPDEYSHFAQQFFYGPLCRSTLHAMEALLAVVDGRPEFAPLPDELRELIAFAAPRLYPTSRGQLAAVFPEHAEQIPANLEEAEYLALARSLIDRAV